MVTPLEMSDVLLFSLLISLLCLQLFSFYGHVLQSVFIWPYIFAYILFFSFQSDKKKGQQNQQLSSMSIFSALLWTTNWTTHSKDGTEPEHIPPA